MEIVSCSLGCSSSAVGGGLFQCTINNIFQNEELRIAFNLPVDEDTVTPSTFQVVNMDTGAPAPGVFRCDPTDPRILIFRPIVTFDSLGQPILGLDPGATYTIKIPGTIQDGPGANPTPVLEFIRSTSGEENTIGLACVVNATRGVFDARTNAPPTTVIELDQLDAAAPGGLKSIQLGLGQLPADIFRLSPIRFTFDDILNPATLVNPVSSSSPTIQVRVDPDGDLSDPSDQVVVRGSFSITIDSDNLRTIVQFEPDTGYPSAGTQPSPRVVVIDLSSAIVDLGGNSLVDAGTYTFIPERIVFPTVNQIEDFEADGTLDAPSSGLSSWGTGRLSPTAGGGSGRLADLVVPAGLVPPLTINTDVEDFSSFVRPGLNMIVPENMIDVPDFSTFTVTGGVFEFSRIVIEPGAVVQVTGSNPLRLYGRGEVIMGGRVLMNGQDAIPHFPDLDLGGTAPAGGPGGGAGGRGGARPDGGGIDPAQANPAAPLPADVQDPALYAPFNGMDGTGIPLFDPMTLAEIDRVAEGKGGLAWPQPQVLPAPNDTVHFPVDELDAEYCIHDEFALCINAAPGGSGGGGAYALSGESGKIGILSASPNAGPPPPRALGGDSSEIGFSPEVYSLSPVLGFLRGGAGGGGGGGHLAGSTVNGSIFTDCTVPAPSTDPLMINQLVTSSSAAGGGGGGALQLQGGLRVLVNGDIVATGGAGGDTEIDFNGNNPAADAQIAQPGGGGAGGAILIQAPDVQVQLVPGVLAVNGGRGGIGRSGSFGGRGSPGLVRIEASQSPPLATTVQQDQFLAQQGFVVAPSLASLQAFYGPAVEIRDYFTAVLWEPDGVDGPTGRTGMQSCWVSQRDISDPNDPTELLSNFFQLDFEMDGAELGWDMLVNLKAFPGVPQSYRGENDLTGPGGMTLQEMFGNQLGNSPVLVRFQSAHAIGLVRQPCDLDVVGTDAQITAGSLSPWVEHPGELATLFTQLSQQPNIFRISVVWDTTNPFFASIDSIEEISVRFTPN